MEDCKINYLYPNASKTTITNPYLYAAEDITIKPFSQAKGPTGVSFEFNQTHVLLVLYEKYPIIEGVVDSDFNSHVHAILYNNTDKEIKIAAGDKIARFELHELYNGLINGEEQLTIEKARLGGFGSTGKL
ncbi:Deoxyuridine 5'-triphosphate nucleotidohydrolase [Cucumispora dikerogammari]|nr:Deoxyuridine 5'-triphosphate nucleotidohydrolase [Cucumispora dikerogammari]